VRFKGTEGQEEVGAGTATVDCDVSVGLGKIVRVNFLGGEEEWEG